MSSVLISVVGGDFKRNIETYLADLETSPVRTLKEMVEFNKKHADVELPPSKQIINSTDPFTNIETDYPDQSLLEKSLEFVLDATQRQRYLDKLRDVGRTRGIDATLAKYNIDVIIGPAESGLTELVSAAGSFPDFHVKFTSACTDNM
jgi:amidase